MGNKNETRSVFGCFVYPGKIKFILIDSQHYKGEGNHLGNQ